MASASPQPIGPAEARRRRSVALGLARAVGFVGRVEYRHVYSQSGGAQYGRGAEAGSDLLTVYAASASAVAEEVVASLLGAMVLEPGPDRDTLVDKAAFELVSRGATVETAVRVITNLSNLLGGML